MVATQCAEQDLEQRRSEVEHQCSVQAICFQCSGSRVRRSRVSNIRSSTKIVYGILFTHVMTSTKSGAGDMLSIPAMRLGRFRSPGR